MSDFCWARAGISEQWFQESILQEVTKGWLLEDWEEAKKEGIKNTTKDYIDTLILIGLGAYLAVEDKELIALDIAEKLDQEIEIDSWKVMVDERLEKFSTEEEAFYKYSNAAAFGYICSLYDPENHLIKTNWRGCL